MPAPAAKLTLRPVTKVSVEKHESRQFAVTIVNSEGQVIRPVTGKKLRDVLTEAADWADFFGVPLTPYRIAGVPIEPVRKNTYSTVEPKTWEEMHAAYRHPVTKELNFNKVMHHEWPRLQSVYQTKHALLVWLLPHQIDLSLGDPGRLEWLKANVRGSWMAVKGGVRFSNDQEAALFKLFFHQ